jgi:predicted RNase H-like HicB family nuclease
MAGSAADARRMLSTAQRPGDKLRLRRNSTMTPIAVHAAPIAVDVTVTLMAIVRPEPDAGGYSASIPALPGCHTQGETLDEVRANLREAAEGWLAVAHDDGMARDASGTNP